MFTIFSIPKPFDKKNIAIIQQNAINSWKLLGCDIILLGNEKGVLKIAKEFNLKHIPDVACNELKTPLLDSAFKLASKASKTDKLIYINADIILFPDFLEKIKKIDLESYLLSGRRYDLSIENLMDFQSGWEKELEGKIRESGELHEACGMDYFVFNKNDWKEFPPFAVGRPGWDNWFIFQAKKRKIPVVDGTLVIEIVHQNHDYSHCEGGDRDNNSEAKKNLKIADKRTTIFTTEDADFVLKDSGLLQKKSSVKNIKRFILTLPAIHPEFSFLYIPINAISKIKKALKSVILK